MFYSENYIKLVDFLGMSVSLLESEQLKMKSKISGRMVYYV